MSQLCEDCEGCGEVEQEFGVPDYVFGGYLTVRLIKCPACEGLGLVSTRDYWEKKFDEE